MRNTEWYLKNNNNIIQPHIYLHIHVFVCVGIYVVEFLSKSICNALTNTSRSRCTFCCRAFFFSCFDMNHTADRQTEVFPGPTYLQNKTHFRSLSSYQNKSLNLVVFFIIIILLYWRNIKIDCNTSQVHENEVRDQKHRMRHQIAMTIKKYKLWPTILDLATSLAEVT